MRTSYLAAVPLFAALSASPAGAQASARLHIDIPIGRRPPVAYAAPRQQLVVREYDPRLFGSWESYYDEWLPETVYLYDGYYYDYPIVPYAEPIVVYRYRNEIFFAPRQREFIQWREQRDYRDIGRAYRPVPRNGFDSRGYQAPRGYNGGQYRPAPQDGLFGGNGRQYQAPQDSRNGRDIRPAPQGGWNGRGMQPAPQDGRNGRNLQPVPQQGGRNNAPSRGGGDRSRPHGR